MIPEWLKTSKRHQAEILVAGIALWQLKRQLDKRHDNPEEPDGYPYPLSENVGPETVFVWPTDFKDNKEPGAVSVGLVSESAKTLSVSGIFEGANRIIRDGASDTNRRRLRHLKKKIKEAGGKIQERESKPLT